MEHLPPGRLGDVATKRDLVALEQCLDLRFEALEERIDLRSEALEHKLMAAFSGELQTVLTAQSRQLAITFGGDGGRPVGPVEDERVTVASRTEIVHVDGVVTSTDQLRSGGGGQHLVDQRLRRLDALRLHPPRRLRAVDGAGRARPWPKLTLVVSLEAIFLSAIFLSAFVLIGQKPPGGFPGGQGRPRLRRPGARDGR